MTAQNQYTTNPIEAARRRAAIVAYYQANGAPATAEAFSISRARVYQIVERLKLTRKPRK